MEVPSLATIKWEVECRSHTGSKHSDSTPSDSGVDRLNGARRRQVRFTDVNRRQSGTYPSGSGHLLEFSDLDKALGIVT